MVSPISIANANTLYNHGLHYNSHAGRGRWEQGAGQGGLLDFVFRGLLSVKAFFSGWRRPLHFLNWIGDVL